MTRTQPQQPTVVKLTGSAKHRGKRVGTVAGLVVFAALDAAKRDGLDRLWLSVRHRRGRKRWRVYAVRTSPYTMDLQLEEVRP